MLGFLVERYWPGVTAADVDAVGRRLTELGGAGATFVASTLIPADGPFPRPAQPRRARAVLPPRTDARLTEPQLPARVAVGAMVRMAGGAEVFLAGGTPLNHGDA